MTIIDGIGDEVTYFFIAVAVIVIATIAWITTDIQQGIYVRTVYLLEHSRINQTRIRLSNHTESATISEGIDVQRVVVRDRATRQEAALNDEFDDSYSNETLLPLNESDDIEDESEETDEQPADGVDVVEEGPADIIETMDATDDGDAATLLRRRRLEHFQNRNVNNATDDNTSNAKVADDESSPTPMPETQEPSAEGANITIKLKYINDDMKIVDGRLEEKLGDFKRRHFNVELSSNKLVRLIFNGQVLQADAQSLESYGMFDNCVVHCLVHQPRTPPAGETSTHGGAANSTNRSGINMSNNPTTQRDWDLGNLLLVTLSFTLGSAWYFRFQYPQLFTISTTVGLVALSGMFSVVAVSIYLPHLTRRVRLATDRNAAPSAATETNTNNRT